MTVIRLAGGRIVDPAQANAPVERDLFLREGRIWTPPNPESQSSDVSIDVANCYVMAGGIDIHTHIGGGKTNIARLLLANETRHQLRSTEWSDHNEEFARRRSRLGEPLSAAVPPTIETGQRYLQMGYTTCIEPAILPANARQAHWEMGDTPWLSTGGFLVLGNDEILLQMLSENQPQDRINQYVALMLIAHRCIGVKVVNATGISSFKGNIRETGLDTPHERYNVTGRQVIQTLSRAVDELGITHPLHVHCNHLGRAGNINTTIETIRATEGHRIHITHAQFHCYGQEGAFGYSSAAGQLAQIVNSTNHVTIDVGQVLFGQTVTLSADIMHQFANFEHATPKRLVLQDTECQAGCGVLPFRYRHKQFVHNLQWTIGLELMLRIDDPKKVFLTTDHPNGGPFTAYPHILRLLGDSDFRNECFEALHPEVQTMSGLNDMRRRYSITEMAEMTRLGPANSLGLHSRGKLIDGAVADVVVYPIDNEIDQMFAFPKYVFRNGNLVWREDQFIGTATKDSFAVGEHLKTHLPQGSDKQFFEERWQEIHGNQFASTRISADEFESYGVASVCEMES